MLSFSGRDIINEESHCLSAVNPSSRESFSVRVPANSQGLVVDFAHTIDRPFRIRRLLLKLTALDSADRVIDPQPTVLSKLLKFQFFNLGSNSRMARDIPFEVLPDGDIQWKFSAPELATRGQGYQLQISSDTYEINGPNVDVRAILVQPLLDGELLTLAPPLTSLDRTLIPFEQNS